MAIAEIKVPMLAESVADATLLSWLKQPGEAVQESEKVVEIETDKVILDVLAPQAGTLTQIIKNNGETVLSEEVIAHLDTSAKPTISRQGPSSTKIEVLAPEAGVSPKTSPAVRKIAADQGIDPTSLPHQGDRITKADILHSNQPSSEIQPASCLAPQKLTSPNFTESLASQLPQNLLSAGPDGRRRPKERVPMTRLRKRVAERLLNAQREHAILTTFNEINMKAVIDLRNQYKETFQKKYDVKLGFMSFFTKAAVAALQKFPILNASTEGDDIIYHGYYDIGIAVSSQRGLVVPILRDADAMSFAHIEKAISDFARRAQDAQLSIEEITGGTFTITNGGIFGSMLSTPILNPPQSAILGMHNIVERPIAEKGQVVIRPMMYVALSYDHRIIDGREAVQFLVTVKNAIEDPARLFLEI